MTRSSPDALTLPLFDAPLPAAYRVDGELVSGARFYQLACDPRRSVTVEACAGAGKTWMLVSRILRALLDGAAPRQVLAITFTKKAAGEMRERLSLWLREFAAASEAQRQQALRDRGLAPAEAQALSPRLQQLHEALLDSGEAVEIRTFHGWFSQLLRAAPLAMLAEIGLAPGAVLLEDPLELAPELFRRFHAEVRADEQLRADYFALVQARGRSSLRKWLEAAWLRRVEVEAADAAGRLDDSVAPPGALWPEFANLTQPAQRLLAPRVHTLLLTLARELGAQKGATPQKQGAALEQALAESEAATRLAAVRQALLTKQGAPRAKLDAPSLPEALAHLDDIQRAAAQQQAHDDHLRLARLARVLLAAYAALKRQRGVADMADLEHCALHLLRDSSLAGWVQERLDQRLRHVLIDEFQDTSPLQWRALHGWLSSYAGAGGGASGQRAPAVFIVGDPKQSIYRFRGAEPRVFAAARAFVRETFGGAVLECDHTRRNAPAVIESVNTAFAVAEQQGAYEGFRAHTTGAAIDDGEVIALPRIARAPREAAATASFAWRDSLTVPRVEAEESLRQQEAAQVAAQVAQWIADGVPPGEVFVLARRRSVLHEAALALQAAGIAHVAPEDHPLLDVPEVRDLVAVLDVLASPLHDLSLAHALRSPLFGASDDDLLWLAARAGRGRWWPALMGGREGDAPRPPALERAAALLQGWRTAMPALPPHDLLDRILHEADWDARLLAVLPPARRLAARQAVDALLALSLQLDGARYASVYGFVRALKRRPLAVQAGAAADAVQLLTVHGAKGLEARCVLLMDCDAGAPGSEGPTLLVDWPVDAEAPRACAFIASESRCPPSLQPLLAQERAARAREELNGLYVAMTRAQRTLALSAVEPHREVEASWWSRLVEGALPVPAPAPALQGGAARAGDTTTLLQLPPTPPTAAPRQAAAPALDDQAARLGEALHRVLEWQGNKPGSALPPLVQQAVAAYGLPESAQRTLLSQAQAVLQGPQAAAFFDAGRLAWAGNEVSVADGDELLRLDRLVAFDEAGGARTWWVLDYKLQTAPLAVPAYVQQLTRYRDLLRRLQPADRVRAAFITAAGEVLEIE